MLYLRTLPSWLETIAGGPCERAKLWPNGSVVAVELSMRDGRSTRVQIAASGAIAVRERGRAPRRASVPAGTAAGFVRDVIAVDRWVMDGHAPHGLAPAAARLRVETERVDVPFEKGPSRAARDRDHRDDPVTEVDAFLALANGWWSEVDAIGTQPWRWWNVLKAGVAGDVETATRLAAALDPADGALSLVAAAGLELLEHLQAAMLWNAAGVQHQWPNERSGVYVRLARLAIQVAERDGAPFEPGVRWARAAVLASEDDPRTRRIAAERLLRAGAHADARAVFAELAQSESVEPRVLVALAHLELWAEDDASAAPLVRRLRGREVAEYEAELARLEGILAYRAGDFPAAEDALQRALTLRPDDVEAGLVLAELRVRDGRASEGIEVFERSRARAETEAHRTLSPALYGDPDHPPEHYVEDCIEAMRGYGGNRGTPLTHVERHPDGSVARIAGLRRDVGRAMNARDASAAALRRLRTEPAAQVAEHLTSLIDRHPNSPHPHCYRGELWLWLGDLDRAYADFSAGSERSAARWAFVGRGAVHVLRGDLDAAEREFEACGEKFTPVPGATTHAIRAEGLRRAGRYREALGELDIALSVKQGRVSAWMNRVLCHLALGEREAAEDAFRLLRGRWPWVLFDAESQAGVRFDEAPDVVLETALTMMRGNRSSHLITYFVQGSDDSGMRILQDAERWSDVMGRVATYVRSELRGRVIDRALGEG
jgi:tetratricopeptide (TPR) repeat protein